jgi:predicted  nucleic acid-binding Zn-ribbon protein
MNKITEKSKTETLRNLRAERAELMEEFRDLRDAARALSRQMSTYERLIAKAEERFDLDYDEIERLELPEDFDAVQYFE